MIDKLFTRSFAPSWHSALLLHLLMLTSVLCLSSCANQAVPDDPYTRNQDGFGVTRLTMEQPASAALNTWYIAPLRFSPALDASLDHYTKTTLRNYVQSSLSEQMKRRGIQIATHTSAYQPTMQPEFLSVTMEESHDDMQSLRLMGRIADQPAFGYQDDTTLPSSVGFDARFVLTDATGTPFATITSKKQRIRFYQDRDPWNAMLMLLDHMAEESAELVQAHLSPKHARQVK